MKSLLHPLVAAFVCVLPVNAEWFFRGTPNGWTAFPMEQVNSTTYQVIATFDGEEATARFKIDRLGDWVESYPGQDFVVMDNKTYQITFDTVTKQINVVEWLEDSWFFRGTPNQWNTAEMERLSATTFRTTVTFAGEELPARFLIDHYGEFSERYPSGGDFFVPDDFKSYEITFDSVTKNIALTPIDAWFFRGTPNQWNTLSMAKTGDTTFEAVISFNGEESPARFLIDHSGDFSESYPEIQDFLVQDFKTYRIVFDSATKAIQTEDVNDQWYFRGTANAWNTAPMTRVGLNTWEFTATFNGEEASARFLIDHFGDFAERYPEQAEDFFVDDFKTYRIRFNAWTKAITVEEMGSVPTGTDFRGETIYFLLTARFYDGDPTNNYYNRDRLDINDPHWRGDFAGLIQQLDYIKDLGFTAIWITPPVENRSGLDYHGYHSYDWYAVDPRLESPGATYQDLINAAKAKGLKIIQDVVINHSSQYGIRGQVWIDHLPIKYYRPAGGGGIDNGPYQGNLGDYLSPFRDDNDNPIAPQWFRDRHTSDPDGVVPLVDPKTGTTIPLAGYNPGRFFGIDPNTLDPNWYHQDGFIAGGDWESPGPLQTKHLAGDAIDLATTRQNVKDYLNGAIKMYLDMGVNAIRVDTVKHIERNNLLEYVNEWRAHKPGLFVFGENLVKGTGFGSELANDNASAVIRPWWYTRTGNNPSNPSGDSGFSVLDFGLFSTFRDNIRNGNFSQIGSVLAMDWVFADPTQLVTFFQNHDVGPDNDFKFRFGGEEWKAALAYNLLWTIRGIPALYYGEEIQFMPGAPQDIDGPNMLVSQTGRAYFGSHLEPTQIAATQSHPLYRHIQRLNHIRGVIPALQKGVMGNVHEFGSGLSFTRDYNDGESYAVVGLAAGGSRSFTVSGVRNGTYTDAVTGNTVTVNSGSLSFSVAGNSVGIYVLNGPGKIGVDGVYLR